MEESSFGFSVLEAVVEVEVSECREVSSYVVEVWSCAKVDEVCLFGAFRSLVVEEVVFDGFASI